MESPVIWSVKGPIEQLINDQMIKSPDDPIQSMSPAIVEFTARGSARTLSSAIEAYAAERRIVNALVVPWESDAAVLRMAVTATKSDGWAIEHTNLGTISLADLGGERTRVVVVAQERKDEIPEQAELRDQHGAVLTTFARQLERKFAATPGESQ